MDSQSNVFVAGSYHEGPSLSSPYNYFAVKYSTTGERQWMVSYDDPAANSDEEAHDMALDVDGSTLITGWLKLGNIDKFLTVKITGNGALQWVRPFGTSSWAWGVTVDAQRNVYITGRWSIFDCGTIKYDTQGDTIWTAFNHDLDYLLESYFLCLDGHENVIISGRARNIAALDYNFFTLKYRQPPTDSGITPTAAPNPDLVISCSPNPFNPSTVISYELRASSYISLKVYDTSGRLVVALAEGWQEAGMHEVTFDGSRLPSGLYFARIQAGDVSAVQKVMLLK